MAGRVLVRARERGVALAFGVHGANIEDVYASADDAGMPVIVAKHEFAAGAMADGVARLTGTPGMVLTTSGGGAMNVIPALAEAYDSRVPVLAVIGAPPTALTGHGAFQDMLVPPDTIDLRQLLHAVTGATAVVTHPEELDGALDEAFATLSRDRPFALVIPKDVQAQPVPVVHGLECAGQRRSRPEVADGGDDIGDGLSSLAATLVDAAEAGQPICIWVGEEVSRTRSGAHVVAIAECLGATLVASPGGADAVEAVDRHAGVTGVMGHPSAREAIAGSAHCVAIGVRMTATDRAGSDKDLEATDLVHIGMYPPRFDCASVCVDSLPDALDVLERELLSRRSAPFARADVAVRSSRTGESTVTVTHVDTPAIRGKSHLSTPEIMTVINDELPAAAAIFADAGNVGAAAVHHLTPVQTGRFTVALGMGGMGYAIAAAIGVALARTSSRTVVIAGDGAFFMHGMEMHTAVEYGADVTLIVLNNNAHGMCVTRESRYFPDTEVRNRFRSTDIAGGLAAMFAELDVRHPATVDELRGDCAELFATRGPNCIVVDCHSDEVPPFLPFL
ncbi:thiamine pyrophosphate-binding protein [Gordonia jinhuaensis]